MVSSNHPEFKKYLDVTLFKKFDIIGEKTGIAWSDSWDMVLPLDTIRNKKFIRINPIKRYSVTDYAKHMSLTRQAVLYQIKDGRLPNGIIAKKGIGRNYIIEVCLPVNS
jgi:hypothetical protein